jgi:hypothetical protein
MASSSATPAATPASMRAALTVLLDGVPGSRRILRHLAAVEHELGRKDRESRFLLDAPLDQLLLVQRQLEGVLGSAPSPGLVALRLRLAESIRDRQHAEELAARRQPLSSFFVDHKLQVSEGGLTDFDQLSAEWNSARPPAKAP